MLVYESTRGGVDDDDIVVNFIDTIEFERQVCGVLDTLEKQIKLTEEMKMKSLKERIKEFGVNLELMEGRTKGDNKELEGKVVTITDYGFLSGSDGEYVAYIVKEIEDSFYFGGTVLTESLKQLDVEGYRDAIKEEGLRIRLVEKRSNKGRKYFSVEFDPED